MLNPERNRTIQGWTKLNRNASFLEADGSDALGAILLDDLFLKRLDDLGEVVMTTWKPVPHFPNVVTTQALGLLYGLRVGMPIYVGSTHVERDN
jgi:hypothetical protein